MIISIVVYYLHFTIMTSFGALQVRKCPGETHKKDGDDTRICLLHKQLKGHSVEMIM